MPHHSLAALPRAYGLLLHLRLGLVGMALAASGSMVAQLLRTHDANFLSQLPRSIAKHLGYNYRDMVSVPYCPRQRMPRKISSLHLFSNKALDDYRHVRQMMVPGGVLNISDFVPALKQLNLQGVVAKTKRLHERFDAFLTAINMFVAGTDTSSSTTEWAVAEPIRQPRILARVQEEIDSVVGRGRLVTELDLRRLTYLQAVSCEINGYHIPKGTKLLVNVWAVARDPDTWAEPLVFRPERFLPGGKEPNVDLKAGRRMCIGMSMGLRMVQLVMAMLAHAFDRELTDRAFRLTSQWAKPLSVHPKPRLASHF
ncbi:hypothetical protein EUGRSUZ_B00579 [Eucalyptus grandis]|uniref:Uncharacterized protein n=2 Tax=Eucalyptus grandis TaxID=71139 RepID=A0ACC3LN13_EUCGR|nr:hypothetical protein EUGRSUZ_B00579 [Eucalyptus grandis]